MFGLFGGNKKYKNINAKDFNEGMKKSSAIILDVRSESEVKEGAIPGYKLINVSRPDFADKVSKLNKEKEYYVYCRSGMRSAKACKVMYDLGFKNLYNLRGGIMAWNRLN